MDIVENFLLRYGREYDYYDRVSALCRQQCEYRLEQEGIRSIVTSRAKRPDRLRDKILKRRSGKGYVTESNITDDIVDLAGVRIALYFPLDGPEVGRIIESQFNVESVKQFPAESQSRVLPTSYEKKFTGYSASHYRVRLFKDKLGANQIQYADAPIEIQVASVLMHAWAEVEHDLVYKPLSGELSALEYAILDELNGLVLTGEIALGRLQEAVKSRVARAGSPFSNHYELAAFLYDKIASSLGQRPTEPMMGRADVLLRFLKKTELDRPEELEQFISQLSSSDFERRGIAEQITDLILQSTPELYDLSIQAKQEIGSRNPYSSFEGELPAREEEEAIKFFMSRWIALETAVRNAWWKTHEDQFTKPVTISREVLAVVGTLKAGEKDRIEQIRLMRNELVHGVSFPSNTELIESGKYLETVLADWYEVAPEDLKPIIVKEVSGFSVRQDIDDNKTALRN